MPGLMKGTVRGYNGSAGTAEVELVGGRGVYVTVPVATHLDERSVGDGKRCALLVFDEQNQGDMVLVATYDEGPLMGAASISHSDLDDLDADDHPQYLNEGRLVALQGVIPLQALSGEMASQGAVPVFFDGWWGYGDPSIMAWPSAATGKVWTKRSDGAGWESAPSGVTAAFVQSSSSASTNSTTYVDLMSISITLPKSGAVYVTFSADMATSYASEFALIRLLDNSGSVVSPTDLRFHTGDTTRAVHAFTWRISDSSGSKTYRIQWRTSSGGSRYSYAYGRSLLAVQV